MPPFRRALSFLFSSENMSLSLPTRGDRGSRPFFEPRSIFQQKKVDEGIIEKEDRNEKK